MDRPLEEEPERLDAGRVELEERERDAHDGDRTQDEGRLAKAGACLRYR
jgi:hypothetical protein